MSNLTTTQTPRRRALLPAALATAALLLVPASSMAGPHFGAKLTPDVQPSNASTAHPCTPLEGQSCTRVAMEGYYRPEQPNAPKAGTIKRVRLIAGEAGSFRLQIAKARPGSQQAKIVRNGPRISYQGQTPDADESGVYSVESFKVNVKVKKGEYLAIKSTSTSMLRCSSGGPNQLLFQPPLALGSPFRTADDTDGCWLLLEAVMK